MAALGYPVFLLVSFGLVTSVEKGFVYCPAYPCTCESVDGALVINCRHLYLSSLPKFLSFDGRIKELSLRYNNIRHLPGHGFQGLHVDQLDLLDNAITFVDQDAFTGLENSLRSLSLQLYAMYGLPIKALSRLSTLMSLTVVGCNQRELLTDLFQNLTALKELHLTGCRIAHIQTGSLMPIAHLKTLKLAQNALQSQHLAEISVLRELLALDLSSNNIHNLSRLLFPGFCKLRRLNIASNNLTRISQETFQNLDFSLEELNVRDNNIDDLALGSLAGLRLLQRLDISGNNIYKLSGEYFSGMRYLQILRVANNKVKAIGRHSFYGLWSSLLELDLHGNPLEFIESSTFMDFHVLEKLNLRHTKLGGTFGPYSFDGLSTSLKYLDVSSSELTNDDLRAISSLTNVTELDVSSNHICSIDLKVLTMWNHLTYANFSYNKVSRFVTGNLSVPGSSLETLDLSWNNIQTIEGCGLFVFRNILDVRLQGNPLVCNCSLSWLYRWLQIRHASQHLTTHKWTCSNPASLQDSYVSDLEFADLKCPHSSDYGGQCLQLYDIPFTHDILSDTKFVPLNSTPSCQQLCLNISRPDANSVFVEWLVRNIKGDDVYNISLTRHNDSVRLQAVILPSSSSNYSFVNIDNSIDMDACIVVLTKYLDPLAEKCHVIPMNVDKDSNLSETKDLSSLIQTSFLPLLCIFISAILAVTILVACIVVCIQRKRKRPKRVKPFYLTYPAWYDNRSSISGTSLVYDPHCILSSNLHTHSTLLADRLGLSCLNPDSSDLPSMMSSRRESRLCPGNQNCTCSTVSSVLPNFGEDSLTGQTEVDNAFFFHF